MSVSGRALAMTGCSSPTLRHREGQSETCAPARTQPAAAADQRRSRGATTSGRNVYLVFLFMQTTTTTTRVRER